MSRISEIKAAAKIIKAGGHILCPTDTVWGLSADATNIDAVNKIFILKDRPKNKSMIVLVSSQAMLINYVEQIPPVALHFIETADKPSSIIYPKAKNLAQNVLAENGSIAIRVVKDGFCHNLINQLAHPIISTSANVSGDPSPGNYSEISNNIKESVDYCVALNQEELTRKQASSIYLIEDNSLKKIR